MVSAGYRSVLGVSTCAPEPLVRVAFWSKQPLAFTRAHLQSHVVSRPTLAYAHHPIASSTALLITLMTRAPIAGASSGRRGDDRLKAVTRLHVVGESAEWPEVLRKPRERPVRSWL